MGSLAGMGAKGRMSDGVTGTDERLSFRTIAIMALVAPLFGGLVVFLVALALFGHQVPADQLFIVVMVFALAVGVLPGIAIGVVIARADREDGASWRMVLALGFAGGILFAFVLFAINGGELGLPPLAAAVVLGVLSVFVAFWWTRALRARALRLAEQGSAE